MLQVIRLYLASLALAAITAFSPLSFANMGGEEGAPSTEPNYVEGKKALEDKDFKGAVAKLTKALEVDRNNPDILNYLGFAHRNNGDLENAMKFYKKALMLQPGHKGANEYIGEAYLLQGNVAKAEEHLNTLRTICVTGCAELSMLKDKIDEHKKKKS